MGNLAAMLWIEARKAIRSRMPIWTSLASLFLPFGIAFLIFVAKNPEISQKMGLIGPKANLVAYSATDWHAYLVLYGQLIAAAGFILFVLITSWVFGREFADGTLKDLLAVPVQRGSILLAKFILVGIWCAALALFIFLAGLAMGVLIHLPGSSAEILYHDGLILVVTGCLVIASGTPFAFFASIGRGYLLPIGVAVLTLMLMNIVLIAGWGEFFPWAVPLLLAQGKTTLSVTSYGVVILTGLVGMLATYLWWKYADQSR